MDFPYFKGGGATRGLLISLSCIFLFMFLSGHWTFADTKILEKHSPKAKHLDIRATKSATERSPTSSEIPVNDEISDLDIEFTNISVTREDMIKGSNKDFLFANISTPEDSFNLPKTVHFVWTGKPIEEKYIKNIQTFLINEDYEIILWTDENTLNALQNPEGFKVKDINSLEFINADAIKDETNPGAKSDIYRLEVVYQFGGIYLDTDSVCLRKFPEILQHSFVTHVFGGYNNLCNCVFGLPKNSNFLRFALDTLKLNWPRPGYRDRDVPGRTGPTFLTSMFVHYNDSNINMIHQDYLALKSDKSILYQSFDGSWLG